MAEVFSLRGGVGQSPHLAVAGGLGAVRSPADVLSVLVENGLTLGVEIWAMAMLLEGEPRVWVGSAAPLEPARLREEMAHFLVSAGSQLGGDSADWAHLRPQAFCLDATQAPLSAAASHHHEVVVRMGTRARALVRATRFTAGGPADRPADWQEVQAMVRAATPYLRNLALQTSATSGILDPTSGVYGASFFLDTLDREIERARRHLSELSLAVVELRPGDLGEDLSVETHAAVGAHLREAVRRTDVVGRLGRRSYAAFLYGTGPRLALIAAGRIAEALSGDAQLRETLAFAIGVSGWEVTGPDARGVLSQARQAAAEALLIAPGHAFLYV